MRKFINFIMIFFILNLISLSLQFEKFTPKQAADWIEERISDYYGKVDVIAKEEEKGVNFHFNVEKELESMDDVYDFFRDTVIYIGEITNQTKWRSDKAGIYFKGKLLAWIYTKYCREAIKPEHDLDRMDFIISKLHFPEK